jgi:catechol 2,3-dioxygenase
MTLPAATRIGAVRLQVADLDRSLAYYERVIGFSVLDRGRAMARLGVEPGQPLLELHEQPGATPMPRRGRLGLYHFAILLPERAALGRFVRHLAELDVAAGMSDHLVSEAIYLSDPDGLGIEVYADRPRDTWQYHGGQLVMATDPLNVPSLLAAAGAAPWTGAPEGTVIGHVHLYVGDLDRAAAFYEGALGLDRMVWSYPGALFLSAGGYHHHLGTNTWAASAPAPGENDAQLLEWELLIPDSAAAAAAVERLSRHGASVSRSGEGGLARDPWGTAVRVGVASR